MIPKSNEIRFEVTTRCNHHCVMCPRDELYRKKELMSFDSFKFYLDKIRQEADQYECVTFSGFGESTLDPGLMQKIEYARKLGYRVYLLTNGTLLTKEKFLKMNELGVDSVRISIHGNTESAYLKTHGLHKESFFHRVQIAINEFVQVPGRRTKVILTFVETEHNRSNIDDFINYWRERVDLIEAWRPHNWVDGRGYREIQENGKLNTCGRPENGPLQIQVDGTVNMCCFDFNGQLLLGDLKTQSLQEIFSDAPFQNLMKCHRLGDYAGSGLICENCDQRNKLQSGREIMIYNSKYDPDIRVNQYSTTYTDVDPSQTKVTPQE